MGNERGLSILGDLKLKDLYMIPQVFLIEDLKAMDEEAFSFYELDEKYWVRVRLDEKFDRFCRKIY